MGSARETREQEEETREQKSVVNHFAAGANCQVFNGNISGCIFAMPGSQVTQQTGMAPTADGAEGKEPHVSSGPIVSQLKPIFYGSEDEALKFLKEIRGMKPTLITQKVKRLVAEKNISELSAHRDLWAILHAAGLYDRSESNWNQQVK